MATREATLLTYKRLVLDFLAGMTPDQVAEHEAMTNGHNVSMRLLHARQYYGARNTVHLVGIMLQQGVLDLEDLKRLRV